MELLNQGFKLDLKFDDEDSSQELTMTLALNDYVQERIKANNN